MIDYKNTGNLKIFLMHYKKHIGLFLLDMLCALLVAAVDLTFPYISKLSMERFLPQNEYKTFFLVMCIMLGAYVVRAFLYYIITNLGHRMGVYMEADMRSELFTHIEKMSFRFFDQHRTGQLMSRVTNDLFEITELAHHGPEDLLISSVTIIGAFIILCGIEWRLALCVFAVIPVFVVFTVILRRRMANASVKVKAKQAVINASIESGFSGIRTAKAFANEEMEIRKFEETNVEYVESKRGYYHAMAVFHAGMEFALPVLSVLVIMIGGYYIMQNTLSYIGLVTFSLYVSSFLTPVRKLVAFVEQYMAGMAGFYRFLEIMRTDPEIVDAEDAIVLKHVQGEIEIKDVSFVYESAERPEGALPEVLSDISLSIPAGTTLALVGPSGGGKTTLSNLIPRFYEVHEGTITIDGTDIRAVTQQSLRHAIGIVQQDVFMFAGTIYENIAYGRPDATFEEIQKAAKKAEIHEEILQMPQGYDSYIGERGVKLSGGQKQRIGIARIFLKNPPILILDEATSALDSVTEIRIQAAFDELAKGRTSIIVAHRLSTIRNADHIAVIDGGRVREYGTHQELMEKNGMYAALVSAQSISQ